MLTLLTVIGARPQIIKAAAFSRVLRERFQDVFCERILHTGQHYDDNMSEVFFRQLGIPEADYNLGVGSGRHGVQTAKMIMGIEEVLMNNAFDGIVLYGDTNSTLAGAVAASKLHVPIFHIEAGLRSFNMSMPEEVNRIVCDRLASLCFAPTNTAVENLRREGISAVLSGDVMYDNALYFGGRVGGQFLSQQGLSEKGFVLATVHRDFNTDNPARLKNIFEALRQVADDIPVVLPLHPRTRAKLAEQGLMNRIEQTSNIRVLPPQGFFEMLALEKNAALVMTDSGGVQKEAFFFERPCVILRPETEWVEIVQRGAGILADADTATIVEAYRGLMHQQVCFPPLFGSGEAAYLIAKDIRDFLSSK